MVSKGITLGLTASVGLEQYKDDGCDKEEVGDGGDDGDDGGDDGDVGD